MMSDEGFEGVEDSSTSVMVLIKSVSYVSHFQRFALRLQL